MYIVITKTMRFATSESQACPLNTLFKFTVTAIAINYGFITIPNGLIRTP